MTDHIAYLPLETYPESAPDNAILAVLRFAGALGCKVQASAFAVTIPPVASPLGGGLINIEGMAKLAEERSRETCGRLKELIEGAAPGLRSLSTRSAWAARWSRPQERPGIATCPSCPEPGPMVLPRI